MNITDLSNNKLLNSQTKDITKELMNLDNFYRNTAWLSYVAFMAIAFFMSLVIAEFDFNRLGEAQFWIDLGLTFGGGIFLKWMFSKWGASEGHKHPMIMQVNSDIEKAMDTIRKRKLIGLLKDYLDAFNYRSKLAVIHRYVYQMRQLKPHSKHWRNQQMLVKTAEDLLEEKNSDKRKELEKILFDNGFDVGSYKVRYKELKEEALSTGFSSKNNEVQEYVYDENYQLFGKDLPSTVSSLISGLVLAVTVFSAGTVNLSTIAVFMSRASIFTYNSMSGFVSAKSIVETVKLNILKNIFNFLTTFLELNPEEEKVNGNNPSNPQNSAGAI